MRLHSSQRITSSLGAVGHPGQVGGADVELAAAAPPVLQRADADPAELGAQLVVQREQVGRDLGGQRLPLGLAGSSAASAISAVVGVAGLEQRRAFLLDRGQLAR